MKRINFKQVDNE